jgi:glycerol-3-phosphate dehydrogenase (NAD(P)+)
MLGEHLGRGATLQEAESRLNGRVAEGVRTTSALFEIKQAFEVNTPIIDTLHRVLSGHMTAHDGYLSTWNQPDRSEGD